MGIREGIVEEWKYDKPRNLNLKFRKRLKIREYMANIQLRLEEIPPSMQ